MNSSKFQKLRTNGNKHRDRKPYYLDVDEKFEIMV